MTKSLLVIGVHREELAFGDRVVEGVDQSALDILRIPVGISHSRTSIDDAFYFETRHREIYLQLHQQVKKRYCLLIDLHCGKSTQGHYAEVFTHDELLNSRLNTEIADNRWMDQVRVIQIIAQRVASTDDGSDHQGEPKAITWIPEKVWTDRAYFYVGLEVYLAGDYPGTPADWSFTRDLIEVICSCGENG